MRPVIAVSTYGLSELRADNRHYDRFYCAPAEYVAAVERAGGSAVLLPPVGEPSARLLDVVDGVLLAGGTDVDPRRYGGDPADQRVAARDPARDGAELALARAVLDAGVPALFVCRGLQVLNVVRGGSLHPHLADLGRGDIHRGTDGMWTTHPVEVVAGSLLASVMGATEVAPASGHHQGIDGLGEALEVVAVAPDGIVEAVSVPDHPWAVAVQWHPEVTAATDPTQQAIFDALVAASADRRR